MNEFDFINRLRRQTNSRSHSSRLIAGIGDDASIIRQTSGRDLVVTTDLLVEGVDFYLNATPPRLLGHKALAVSLSDVAAMGARPLWSFLSFGLPRERWETNFKDEFMEGYLALADRFGVALSGGDVSESNAGIVIDSIVIGEVESGAAVKRSGARPGEQIYVTGNLGGAAAGLKLIEMGHLSEPPAVASGPISAPSKTAEAGPPATAGGSDTAIQSLILRQLCPDPRVGWGMVLGEQHLATAMIDISDGLSSDLHHLSRESNVGALIDASSIPLDDNVKHLCGRRALDPLALGLHGGEDFELLFTVAVEDVKRLPKRVDGIPMARIGTVTAAPSIQIQERDRLWDLLPQGFAHFKR
ncbi:MAG TPA: thiamine-phosphate kinase [Pyrinomonadaceae bacterium]|nr:thiamine-phosphate kinase [Pyrinomonadaceae bacterium]